MRKKKNSCNFCYPSLLTHLSTKYRIPPKSAITINMGSISSNLLEFIFIRRSVKNAKKNNMSVGLTVLPTFSIIMPIRNFQHLLFFSCARLKLVFRD